MNPYGSFIVSFRLWSWTFKFALPLMIAACAAAFAGGVIGEMAASVAFLIVVLLAICGASMGVLMSLGRLSMRCPFCGSKGQAWADAHRGLQMCCPTCGIIRGKSATSLKLICEDPAEVERLAALPTRADGSSGSAD